MVPLVTIVITFIMALQLIDSVGVPPWQKNHICHALSKGFFISWGGTFQRGTKGWDSLKGVGIEAPMKFPSFFLFERSVLRVIWKAQVSSRHIESLQVCEKNPSQVHKWLAAVSHQKQHWHHLRWALAFITCPCDPDVSLANTWYPSGFI